MIEAHGITTSALSINRGITEGYPAPRNAYLNFPYGSTFGEPGNAAQHLTILRDLLRLVREADTPGQIVDLPYRWKREQYQTPTWDSFPR